MGKSPGKWIKTVLLGKKHSKSNLSKSATVERKDVAEQTAQELGLGQSAVVDTPYQGSVRSAVNAESEKVIPGGVSSEPVASFPVEHHREVQDLACLTGSNDEETAKVEQAAIKAQAAFRGYLARRAFWALKGIIRLQALIRGHLVRRQAVATLRCLQSIVRLQALARGRMVRISYPGLEPSESDRMREIQETAYVAFHGMNTTSRSHKLSTNAFACKLLSLFPKAMALSVHYGPKEPNSIWVWLERWSLLRFWEPLPLPKAAVDAKLQAKQINTSSAEGEKGKSRRTFRKVASTTTGETVSLSSSEADNKPRRNPRKLASLPIESPQEHPQSELEKVKRNLRKVSASALAASEKSEPENDKPHQTPKKSSDVTAAEISESASINQLEKASELTSMIDNLAETEKTLDPPKVDEPVHLPQSDNSVLEQISSVNGTKTEVDATVNEDMVSKEDHTGKENLKTRRRKSLPVKQDYPEKVSQNTQSLPSYMAATESAKAKLKLQASIKFSEDGVENSFVRRHSLPTSTNGKFSSMSPQVQKYGQVNDKGGLKSNKSLSASRDERVLQPGWRR